MRADMVTDDRAYMDAMNKRYARLQALNLDKHLTKKRGPKPVSDKDILIYEDQKQTFVLKTVKMSVKEAIRFVKNTTTFQALILEKKGETIMEYYVVEKLEGCQSVKAGEKLLRIV